MATAVNAAVIRVWCGCYVPINNRSYPPATSGSPLGSGAPTSSVSSDGPISAATSSTIRGYGVRGRAQEVGLARVRDHPDLTDHDRIEGADEVGC